MDRSWQQRRSRQSSVPDSSLKEVKLMSIWTLTSPQPLTSSLKSSAVKSSRAFLGSTSSKPFLIAYETRHDWREYTFVTDICLCSKKTHFKKRFERKLNIILSLLLTWRGCSATTSILCSAYFLTYSYTLTGVTGMLTPPDRSSTWTTG